MSCTQETWALWWHCYLLALSLFACRAPGFGYEKGDWNYLQELNTRGAKKYKRAEKVKDTQQITICKHFNTLSVKWLIWAQHNLKLFLLRSKTVDNINIHAVLYVDHNFPEGQISSINLRSERTKDFFSCGWKTFRTLYGVQEHRLCRYSQKSIKTNCTQSALWIIPRGRTTQKKARKPNTSHVLLILKLSKVSLQHRYVSTETKKTIMQITTP